MRWIIDGYNVTRTDPATRDLPLEEQRRALESRLRTRATRLLGTSDYLVVWDGFRGSGNVSPGGTHAAFTRMPTADDSIVSRVRSARERVGVVTSDNELANRCRGVALHGVEIRPSSSLFETAKGKKSRKEPRMARDVGIPSNANEINRELKKLWGIED